MRYQHSPRMLDAQSVINWTVVGQLSWQYLRAPTLDRCSLSHRSSSSVYSRDVLEWLAIFSFPPIPTSSFPFPILFPWCLRFNSHSRPVTKICSHSLTNERHLSLNNQTMINVQNENTQLSQAKNLNSESPTVSVTLSSTHNDMSRNFDRWEFWHTRNSSRSRSNCHAYSSHFNSHFWHACVPVPVGFPRECESHPHAQF